MACGYLATEQGLCRCRAVRGLVTPSLHERERFCRNEPARCPTYQLRARRDEALPEEVYYALWLPVFSDEAHAEEAAGVP